MTKNNRWQWHNSRGLIEDCVDIRTFALKRYWNWFLHLPSHNYLQTVLRRIHTIMSFRFSYNFSAKSTYWCVGWDLNPHLSGDVTRNLSFFVIVLFLGEWHYLLPALAAKLTPSWSCSQLFQVIVLLSGNNW
jgi:hypothetical protein